MTPHSDTDAFDDLRFLAGHALARADQYQAGEDSNPVRDGVQERVNRLEAYLENLGAAGLQTREKLDEELQQIDDCVEALGGPRDNALAFLKSLAEQRKARPLDDWHEGHGEALWWRFPIEEPPYVGSPLDDDWPGYHTHWTPLPPCPEAP